MSNASGSLNSLASSSVIDLGGGAVSENHENVLGRSRRVTLVWGVLLGLLGLLRWGPVLEAGLTIASITYGGLLGVFLLGTYSRRATESGALVGFVAGVLAMIAVHLFTPLAFTWYVLAGSAITFAVGNVSRSTRPAS
jgi:Na+/proline symporter